MKAKLEAKVRELNLKNVIFRTYHSQYGHVKLLSASADCLVSLKEGMERYALPSKTFTFLAVGKPIGGLLQPGNDVYLMIDSHGVGWNSTYASGLAKLVRRLCDS